MGSSLHILLQNAHDVQDQGYLTHCQTVGSAPDLWSENYQDYLMSDTGKKIKPYSVFGI